MEELLTLIYDGGAYRFSELVELLEDTGSFILRREDTAVSTTAVLAVPMEDLRIIEEKAKAIGGSLTRAALAGSEIAVVAPSPSGRHLPHPTCDIAEFLRRNGTQTILISLARGVGQEPMLQFQEERLINESDLAVFVFGDSKFCLRNRKPQIFENLKVPVIVTGGPPMKNLPNTQGYVGGFGRRTARMIGSEDLKNLRTLVEVIDSCLMKRKKELYADLPPLSIPALSQAIENQIPEIMEVISPSPITIKVDGLRVKLPFDEFHDRISRVRLDSAELRDVAEITKSVLKDQILVRLKTINT